MRVLRAINTDVDGCCKTLYARVGRLSWENYLGRLEHGGWDSQMTCIMEYTDEEDIWSVQGTGREGCDSQTEGQSMG